MSVTVTKASTTKRKIKKSRHIGTMMQRASNAEIERSSWYAGKRRRDKLRGGLYLLGTSKSSLLDHLKSYTADIKNELNSAFEAQAKYIPQDEHKVTRKLYTGKLPTSIHKAPLKIQTICFQLATSQLEKQNSTMIALPFTYLLTQEQVELCRNQHDRGFASRLGQRIQRKLREILGYSPAFYFTFENPEASVERQTSFHDRLPHIHGALLFRPEDEEAIWQAFYDLNKADPRSIFHSREFRIHHKERKECVDALGEFDADIGWAIYQTKAVQDLKLYNHVYKIKGFEDYQFATREVMAAAKAIYANFRVIYNKFKPTPVSPTKIASSSSSIAICTSIYSIVINEFFEELENAGTTTTPVMSLVPPTTTEIETLCETIMKSFHQKKERECICNDIYKHAITGDMIIQSIKDGKNLFDGINNGRAPVLRIACDLLIEGTYTQERLTQEFQRSGKNTPYAKRRASVVHNSLRILNIIPTEDTE